MIINTPTIISADAVAAEGMEAKIGERKSEIMNIPAVTRDVRPVLPPAMMPDDDSTNVVTVEVPNIAPTVVPTASLMRALPQFGIFPSSLISPEASAHPTSVPTVLNISSNRKVNTTIVKSMIDSGDETISLNAKSKK